MKNVIKEVWSDPILSTNEQVTIHQCSDKAWSPVWNEVNQPIRRQVDDIRDLVNEQR